MHNVQYTTEQLQNAIANCAHVAFWMHEHGRFSEEKAQEVEAKRLVSILTAA